MHETPPARRWGSFYLPLKRCRKTASPPRKNYIGFSEKLRATKFKFRAM